MARFLVIKMKENNSKLFFFSSLMAVKVDLNEIVFCFCCTYKVKVREAYSGTAEEDNPSWERSLFSFFLSLHARHT